MICNRVARYLLRDLRPCCLLTLQQGGDDLVELERQLSAAIQLEDFTKAAKIRDLIRCADAAAGVRVDREHRQLASAAVGGWFDGHAR